MTRRRSDTELALIAILLTLAGVGIGWWVLR